MVRREILPPIIIVLLPQIPSICNPGVRRVYTCAATARPVRPGAMSQMAPKDQQIPRRQLDRYPLLPRLPRIADPATLCKFHGHSMRSRHDLDTAIGDRRSVDGNIRSRVLDLTDMIVRWGVQVSAKTVAAGKLVVDFILEEQHVVSSQLLQDI